VEAKVETKKRSATRRSHFTDKRIARMPVPAERTHIYDDTVPGLGLKLETTGSKSFFWFRTVNGTPTWKKIGDWPSTSVEQARGDAIEKNGELEKLKRSRFTGENPFASAREELTLDQLVEQYITRHVRAHAHRPERAEKDVRYTIKKYLTGWRERKLSHVLRKDVLDLHTDLGRKHKHCANRVVQLLRALFNFANASELWNGENPAARVKLFHEAKRTRFLAPEELARLGTALKSEPNPDLNDYVGLALWTGARKSDVLSMRWADVSLEDNKWTVPDPKNRTPYTIALTPEAVKILKNRKQKREEDNPWVFPSFGRSGHIVDLKGRWKALLERAQINGLRQHDLRRTLGSFMAAQGTGLLIIGKSLGHRSVQATAIYSQLDLDPVRASVQAATAVMSAAMRRKPRQLPA
jgi:integrase